MKSSNIRFTKESEHVSNNCAILKFVETAWTFFTRVQQTLSITAVFMLGQGILDDFGNKFDILYRENNLVCKSVVCLNLQPCNNFK